MTDTADEWVAYYEERGFVLRGPDEAPDPTDFVMVSRLQESGPEFLHDDCPRFRRPDQATGIGEVVRVRLVAKRAPDGGYGVYTYNENTHAWTLICGYGPGEAAIALLCMAIEIAVEDDAVKTKRYADPKNQSRARRRWTNSISLYRVCQQITRRVRAAQKEEA